MTPGEIIAVTVVAFALVIGVCLCAALFLLDLYGREQLRDERADGFWPSHDEPNTDEGQRDHAR